MKKPPHHEAVERVGRALYGELWIGELRKREWQVGKDYRAEWNAIVTLPSSGKSATAIAKACFRSRASKEQYEQVFHWLQQEFQGDYASDFETWFRKKFPTAPLSSTEIRQTTVRAALASGQRPGRGGNVRWDKFCDAIRKQSGQRCDDKTIKRDVAEISRPAK